MLQWTIGKLLLPPKCFCVYLFLLSLGEEVLQGTIGKHSLLVHAFPKCFCCAIIFFFPLEKNRFKRQIRKHSLCMHLPKCFCCASVSSFPWREELLQGTNSRTLPPCACILQSAFAVHISLSLAEQVLSREKRETPAAS